MWLRPEISGFSLDTMFGPLGTKDEDRLRIVESHEQDLWLDCD